MNKGEQVALLCTLLDLIGAKLGLAMDRDEIPRENDLESNVVILKDHIKQAIEALPNYSEEYEQ